MVIGHWSLVSNFSLITNHLSPITYHQSPITHHQLPITNYQLPNFQASLNFYFFQDQLRPLK
ncbi:MAG TPA: hypothetical protein DC064_01045 [Cyanobacteria bacterium UBA9273]|nr:hypothetical protein [Cyanobacteria bacterium UBA9273]